MQSKRKSASTGENKTQRTLNIKAHSSKLRRMVGWKNLSTDAKMSTICALTVVKGKHWTICFWTRALCLLAWNALRSFKINSWNVFALNALIKNAFNFH